jgi:hypothetical protein
MSNPAIAKTDHRNGVQGAANRQPAPQRNFQQGAPLRKKNKIAQPSDKSYANDARILQTVWPDKAG